MPSVTWRFNPHGWPWRKRFKVGDDLTEYLGIKSPVADYSILES